MAVAKAGSAMGADPFLFYQNYPAFRRLPSWWSQWDHLVAFAARTGNRSALPAILFHAAVFAVHLLLFQQLMARTVPPADERPPTPIAVGKGGDPEVPRQRLPVD